MNRRRAIITLAGGLAVAIAPGLAACTVRESRTVVVARNPAAPPYDYYYYPEANVYFHVLSGFYYYYYGGYWRRAYALPPHIHLDRRHQRTVVIRHEYPYEKNDDHRRQFGFAPDQHIVPAQAGGSGNQGVRDHGQGVGTGQGQGRTQTQPQGQGRTQTLPPGQGGTQTQQQVQPQDTGRGPGSSSGGQPQMQPKAPRTQSQPRTPEPKKPAPKKPESKKPAPKKPECKTGNGQGEAKGCK